MIVPERIKKKRDRRCEEEQEILQGLDKGGYIHDEFVLGDLGAGHSSLRRLYHMGANRQHTGQELCLKTGKVTELEIPFAKMGKRKKGG